MAFRFPLQAVLLYRQQKETEAERTLSALQTEREQCRAMLQRVQNELAAWDQSRNRDCGTAQPAGSYAMVYARRQLLADSKTQLVNEMANLEQRCAQQMLIYQEARKDRELLSDMKEKQALLLRVAQEKREQRTLDDVFAMRSDGTKRRL